MLESMLISKRMMSMFLPGTTLHDYHKARVEYLESYFGIGCENDVE